ncbi:MAG: threonine synthase [Armatimonadota bacterium]
MTGQARCTICGRPAAYIDHSCICGGPLALEYPWDELKGWRSAGAGLGRFLPLLPVEALPAAMGEGGTPLVESLRVGPGLGVRLYFKLESLNPTGSYKDRIASIGAALAVAHGRTALAATSSGNAGAAIAAYAARAGLAAILLVPHEAPAAKLAQIRSYGATVVAVRGVLSHPEGSSKMFGAVMHACARHGWLPMITAHRYAPAAMEGVKTLAFEIVEAMGAGPDRVYVPVGGGGLFAATWRGFVQAHTMGWADRTPRMIAVQPEGCAPIVQAALGQLHSQHARSSHVGSPPAFSAYGLSARGSTTAISGLQVANPPDDDLVLQALDASRGEAIAVSDDAIYKAQWRLAREEAIFAEPAAATALAGLLVDASAGRVRDGEAIVCLVTGSGFKDPGRLAVSDTLPVLDVSDLGRFADLAGDLVA